MSFQIFWKGVSRTAGLAWSDAVADRRRLTLGEIEERLVTHKRWLKAHVFNFFLEEDFLFLSSDELKPLSDAVHQVELVASEIDFEQAATPDQLNRARPAFGKIVQLMGFDRYDDPDAFLLGKTIERRLAPAWPLHLDHLRFETGPDSTGDPGLWVWAFVAESGEHDTEAFHSAAEAIEVVLNPVTREVAPDRWPYILFRSTLDQLEPEAVTR